MKKTLLLNLFCVWLAACTLISSNDPSKQTSFDVLYENCSMNSIIKFLPLQPNYQFGDNIILSYKNYSQNELAFAPGSGVKILNYEKKSQKWIEINNNMQYSSSPEPYIIVGASDDLSRYRSVVISPDIADNAITEIRVVITGYIFHGVFETDECVSAFIDLDV